MANITKELNKSKVQSTENQQDEAVKIVRLLENGDSQEDLRIANALGSNHSIAVAQTEMGKKLEMEKLDGMYKGNVFTKQQIKDLARKYNMRFLQSKFYCGNIDTEVIAKIKQFSKETNTEITDGNLKYKFFILAPEECFGLTVKKIPKKDPDPAIFYQIDDDHYRMIHQWGNDFNIFNRIEGIMHQSRLGAFSMFLVQLALLLVGGMTIVDLCISYDFGWWYLVPSIVSLILAICMSEPGVLHESELHESKWNSSEKWEK